MSSLSGFSQLNKSTFTSPYGVIDGDPDPIDPINERSRFPAVFYQARIEKMVDERQEKESGRDQ